jgi:hypothetical protein
MFMFTIISFLMIYYLSVVIICYIIVTLQLLKGNQQYDFG